MKPTERIAYSPITERAALELPGGARMAVWVIVNVEEWDIDQAMPRTVLTPPAGGSPMPTSRTGAWHEYGNRVGFLAHAGSARRHEIRAVLAVNGTAVRAYAPIARAARERKWDSWDTATPSATCRRWRTSAKTSGKRPRRSPRRRAASGRAAGSDPGSPRPGKRRICSPKTATDYVADWVLDDQPVVLKTRGRPMRQHPVHPGEQRYRHDADPASPGARILFRRAMDQFDQLYHDAANGQARVMALVVHPYVMGAPHRLKYFRMVFERIRERSDVLFWTGEQILDWYLKERPLA